MMEGYTVIVSGLRPKAERASLARFPLVEGGDRDPDMKSVHSIIKVVAEHYGLTRAELCSDRRFKRLVWPRQVAFWIANRCTRFSLPEIGRRFGNRDHTTVIHGIQRVDQMLDTRPDLRAEIDELIRRTMRLEAEPPPAPLLPEIVEEIRVEVEEAVNFERIAELRSRGYTIRTISAFTKAPYEVVAKHLGFREVRS